MQLIFPAVENSTVIVLVAAMIKRHHTHSKRALFHYLGDRADNRSKLSVAGRSNQPTEPTEPTQPQDRGVLIDSNVLDVPRVLLHCEGNH
ncbi:hypothetical protein ElyMa_003704800 [Elysia marginata]|uniref:Uncharacterized protein n=1 Tax=Elysia marginata TaxID=1093978 RepID=A0AAV4F207_9GAST|nr:hypothetical protein ElyMa_003704800 [Elysia marginata]